VLINCAIYTGSEYSQTAADRVRPRCTAACSLAVELRMTRPDHVHYDMEIDLDEVVQIFSVKEPRRMQLTNVLRD